MRPVFDHLLYATPDVEKSVDELEKLLGVRAAIGGHHPGWGTWNALLSLGPRQYFEIIGPDASQPKPKGPRRFGIDDLTAPRLVTWVAGVVGIDRLVRKAEAANIDLGLVQDRSRQRPDGLMLHWKMTDAMTFPGQGIVPFFIDWGATPHPAGSAPGGLSLVGLRAEHPDPAQIQGILQALDLDLEVSQGDAPALVATISTPRGPVEIR